MIRIVNAHYDDETVTVYQAFSPEIAEPAVAAGTFVPPFAPGRMTWIKPSFLWMMYRSGWATKSHQEQVLAVRIGRDDLAWALSHACLSSFEASVYPDHQSWRTRLADSPVRVQWDPDRDLLLRPTSQRAIQIGLGAAASDLYVRDWTRSITDVTPRAHEIAALVRARDLEAARQLLPAERPYPLSPDLAANLGATTPISPGG